MIDQIKQILNELTIWQSLEEITVQDITSFCIGIFLVALPLILKGVFAKFFINRVSNILTKLTFDAKTITSVATNLQKPLHWVCYLIALAIAVSYFNIDTSGRSILLNLQNSIAVIIVFWVLYHSIDLASKKLTKLKKVLSKELVAWLLKAVRILIVFLAVASVLELWGIKVAPILAGLGLFGVAVALGAQDLFKNLIAGILVIAEHRFENGDWIQVEGVVEGTVSEIGFRSTKITRFDKAPVYVPNTKLSDNVVTNFSRMSHRQIKFKIGLLYSATTTQIKLVNQQINDYIANNDDFAKENVTTFVNMVEFNASSIDLQIYCFTKTTDWLQWLKIREDLSCEIKKIVEDAGTGFAYPSTSIYLEQDNSKLK